MCEDGVDDENADCEAEGELEEESSPAVRPCWCSVFVRQETFLVHVDVLEFVVFVYFFDCRQVLMDGWRCGLVNPSV